VQWVEELIRPDRRMMIDSVISTLGCSHGLAYSIVHDHLLFWKVRMEDVQTLKDQEKMNRLGLPLQCLLWYVDEGEDMLNRIVTGDESWLHHYQPKSDCFSTVETSQFTFNHKV
jgi:hypothetical protein